MQYLQASTSASRGACLALAVPNGAAVRVRLLVVQVLRPVDPVDVACCLSCLQMLTWERLDVGGGPSLGLNQALLQPPTLASGIGVDQQSVVPLLERIVVMLGFKVS